MIWNLVVPLDGYCMAAKMSNNPPGNFEITKRASSFVLVPGCAKSELIFQVMPEVQFKGFYL